MTPEEIELHAQHYQEKRHSLYILAVEKMTHLKPNEVYTQGFADGLDIAMKIIMHFHDAAGGITDAGGAIAAMLAVVCNNLRTLQKGDPAP